MKNEKYLIRFGHTKALLFKKKDHILAKIPVLGNLTHICHKCPLRLLLPTQGQLTALGLPGNQLTRVPVQVIVKLIILFPLEDIQSIDL